MSEADFLTEAPAAPVELPEAQTAGPRRFFNRELSWLAFNWRVLEEAENPRVPLLERVRFLSISATNLDEFYTVRVAGLRELEREGNQTPAADGLTPTEQLNLINEDARKLLQTQQAAWNRLKKELEAERIRILQPSKLRKEDLAFLDRHFLQQVFPVLSPLAIDPAHPFPFIPNTGLSLALQLRRETDGAELQALLPIPAQIDRFTVLPAESGEHRVLRLEDLLILNLGALFPGYELVDHCAFRVLRDSDLEVEEEAEDLVREFETALKRRRRGEVIRLTVTAGAPEGLKRKIMEELHITEREVVELKGLIGVADLKELVLDTRPDLLWPSHTPRVPERVQDHDGDMFAAIRQKDMLLHHPYETFDMVVRYLQQAARDPDVLAIKQTLYRTSKNSPRRSARRRRRASRSPRWSS
jgi:polyphosphate kinase